MWVDMAARCCDHSQRNETHTDARKRTKLHWQIYVCGHKAQPDVLCFMLTLAERKPSSQHVQAATAPLSAAAGGRARSGVARSAAPHRNGRKVKQLKGTTLQHETVLQCKGCISMELLCLLIWECSRTLLCLLLPCRAGRLPASHLSPARPARPSQHHSRRLSSHSRLRTRQPHRV